MSEARSKLNWAWCVGGGLAVCSLLVMLRVGVPLYRRKCAINAVMRVGGIVVKGESRTPRWVRAWVFNGAESPLDRFKWINTALGRNDNALLSRSETRNILTRIADLDEVSSVCLARSEIDDEDLSLLGALTNLDNLNLSATTVTNAGLTHVARLSNLTLLDLSASQVDDEGLAHLAKLTKLEVLKLDGTHVSNAGLDALAKLPALRELSVSNTAVTDGGLEALRKTRPDLEATDD